MMRRLFTFWKQPTLDDQTFVYFQETPNPRWSDICLFSENNQPSMIRRLFIFKKHPTLDDQTFVYFLKTTNPK